MSFICNINGKRFDLVENEKSRESCVRFGYNSRFRAICYVLSKLLFNEVKIMASIEKNKMVKGIGMSDSGWASICEDKFNYINTFYHKEPFLDIYDPDHVNNYKNLDFIISSDVFEHISPFPNIQLAFNNLYKMLKNRGFIVFSVPFSYDKHIEHYPSLYKYEIKNIDGIYKLFNITIEGKEEIYENLCFHGGPGSTLEMRLYSRDSIMQYLKNAGFDEIIFYDITDDMNKYGIFWATDNNDWTSKCSVIVSAKKM
jgi:hypothetical protein